MLLKQYKNHFVSSLETLYDSMEIESFFYIVSTFLHKKNRIALVFEPDFEINNEQLEHWNNVLEELKKEKPIQYILGEAWFFGLRFEVDANTLIPRPETEELVQWIIDTITEENSDFNQNSLKIVDIGTGSGCIPISLKKELPMTEVAAIDVSDGALEVAQKNALTNNITVHFIKKDILSHTELLLENQKWDIIVSNPPYVRLLEKEEIKKNVLEYEPHLALFVADDDALLFYRKIATLARTSLTENGYLFFEINQYLGAETVALLENLGFKNIQLRQDIYGNNRMIRCTLK
ncbi:MAG: peptide chain release factor N(5)-glutamine methyltransferase [Flavobacterium sp.]|jgi:release factor glutamine methyltransferase|nr:peptide chain release factor N(5)-glutamine methyltransferase [Flavobacterium sp.]